MPLLPTLINVPRALTIQSPIVQERGGQPSLLPIRLEGYEGINCLFEYRLTLQTPEALRTFDDGGAAYDLDKWLGLGISCLID